MKNKVYYFQNKDADGGYRFAAPDFKTAKKMAMASDLAEWCENPFIDLRGYMERDEKRKPIRTNYEGRLNVKQLGELHLLWFDCPECGHDDFQFDGIGTIDYKSYKCKGCGFESDIPYTNI